MSEDQFAAEETENSFEMIPVEQVRYVQNCGVSSGGLITADGSHEAAIFLKVVFSKKATSPAEEDEEIILAFVPPAAHDLSEAMHYLSCTEQEEDDEETA